jgi:hypothetical protein
VGDARRGATRAPAARATSAGAPRAPTTAISTYAREIPNETRCAGRSARGRRRVSSERDDHRYDTWLFVRLSGQHSPTERFFVFVKKF